MYLTDYHFHTHNSFDGTASLNEMAQAAANKGINEICVTDHYECNRPSFLKKNTPVSVMRKDYLSAVASNKTGVKIRFGIEIGQPAGNTYQAQMALMEGGFDFVMASVHCVNNGSTCMSLVNYNDPEEAKKAISDYYDETDKIIEWGKFDVLAHFNLFLRYVARQGADINMEDYRGRIEKIFTSLAKSGKGLEVNTKSILQPLGEPIPSLDMLKLYRKCGGEIITIGSDAHEMTEMGNGVLEVREMVKQAGFNKIALFEQRNISFINI